MAVAKLTVIKYWRFWQIFVKLYVTTKKLSSHRFKQDCGLVEYRSRNFQKYRKFKSLQCNMLIKGKNWSVYPIHFQKKKLRQGFAYQVASFLLGCMPSLMCTFAVCLLTNNNVAFLL